MDDKIIENLHKRHWTTTTGRLNSEQFGKKKEKF